MIAPEPAAGTTAAEASVPAKLAVQPVLLAAALALYALAAWWFRNATFDDVHVSFRYARNWFDGFGPTFNPGLPPTEGFSNPLLVWCSMLGLAFGVEPTVLSRILATASGAACVLVADELMRSLGARTIARAIGLCALVACTPSAYWLGTGTDNGLFTLFLLLTMRAALRPEPARLWDAVPPVLLALTRPEGIGLAVLLYGVRLLRRPITRRELTNLALVLGSYAIYLGWRYATFHTLVPNTITAKSGEPLTVTIGHGLSDFARFAASYGYPASILAVLGVILSLRNQRAWVPVAGAGACLGFLLATGGDVNQPELRFAALYTPVFAILTALGAEALVPRLTPRAVPLIGALAIGLNVMHTLAVPQIWLEPGWRTGANFSGHFEIASALRRAAPRGSSVAIFDVGIMAYELPAFRIVDLTGLTDSYIASTPGTHFFRASPAVVDYVFAQAPEFMVLNSMKPSNGGAHAPLIGEFAIVGALMADPRFSAHYSLVGVRRTHLNYYLAVFRRRGKD